MKHRDGYVSNSSSSSFIVAFDKVPETAEELRKMLFDDDTYHIEVPDYSEDAYSIYDISERVFKDIQEYDEKEVDLTYMPDGFVDCLLTKAINKIYLKRKQEYLDQGDFSWDDYLKLMGEIRHLKLDAIEAFFTQSEGKTILLLNYGDNYGDCELEHGEIFKKLRHLRFYQH